MCVCVCTYSARFIGLILINEYVHNGIHTGNIWRIIRHIIPIVVEDAMLCLAQNRHIEIQWVAFFSSFFFSGPLLLILCLN